MPVEVIGSIGPRPYQQEGIEFLRTRKRAAIWDEMGLGKTSQALYAIPPGSQTLVLTVKSALGVWENEAAKWLGLDVMTYVGPPKQRESTWQSYCAAGSILVAPYSMTSELVRRRAVRNRSG
jgi:SNF2 family DNA or RNA helicase